MGPRTAGGSLVFVAMAIPMACGLSTSGLGQPERGTPSHDAAIPDAAQAVVDASDAPGETMPSSGEGGGGDGGDDGATPVDATGDPSEDSPAADAGSPCATGVLFCDGFEQGLGQWPKLEQTNGTIGLDATHVHRGAQAVRAHEDAISQQGGNPSVTIDHTQAWPSHFWLRFFVYVPSPVPPSAAALVNLIQASGSYPGLQLFLSPDSANVSMTTYFTGADQTWRSSTTSGLDQWVCFEVEADVSKGVVHVSMNDTVLTDLDRTGLALPSPDLTKLGLGFYQPNTQGAYDVWYDDVIVDSQPIGCAK